MPPGDDAGGEDEFAGLPEVGVLLCQHTSSCTSLVRLHAALLSSTTVGAGQPQQQPAHTTCQSSMGVGCGAFTHHLSSCATHRVVCMIH